MASGSLDGNESNLIERRRWGDNSKVYTRKLKGQRNNNNNNSATAVAVTTTSAAAETATTAEPAAIANDVNKANENPDISNSNAPEPSTQTLAVEDGKSLPQEQPVEASPPPPPPPRQEEPVVEECNRLGQEEGVSRGETAGAKSTEVLPESREAVVPPQPSGNEALESNEVVRQQAQPESEPELRVPVITRVEDRVRINVSGAKSRDEIRELRRKLESEVDQVRSLFTKLEGKELQLTAYNSSRNSNVRMVNDSINNAVSSFGGAVGNFTGYGHLPQYMANEVVERRRVLTRVNSEVGSVGYQETRPFNRSLSVSVGSVGYQEKRPFSRSLSVSMVDNDHGVGDFVEREKRTPKANQFYRKSEFLLGKDRLPSESNKKLKPNGSGRKHGGEVERGHGFGFDKHMERMFRSCSNLLQRLMKHNFSWVFNEPVDATKLGLHDYHDIIKRPMDLGTIKTRLSLNYYKSPREFADDVRLVFHNAMTYNPKGQDVHVMAEQLLKIFEERWAVIEIEYNPDWRYQMYHDAGLPTPTSRKAPPTQFYTPARAPAPAPALAPISPPAPVCLPTPATTPVTPVPQARTFDRSESMTTPVDRRLKPSNIAHVGRTPALKKPKARDPNKRNMTYEEKQKLSTKLQSLPSEKLDAIVQIIKKRNSTLNQHNDEIEVDIDSVDAETLWELDRFVTNYKKNLSKNKRKAEVALQARAEAVPMMIPVTNSAAVVVDAQKESKIGESNAPPRVQTENLGDNASRSSSSSSSSSDSGSSSSDSDSDSSSTNGSDAGRSPRT